MEKYIVGIISVPKYQSEYISDLPFCANDCTALNETLNKHLGIGYENIRVLGNTIDDEISRTEILKNVRYISRKAEQDDIIILFFSGHGYSENNVGYLATFDTDLDLASDTSISISRIKSELEKSQAKKIMIILDSCYSGIKYGKKFDSKMTEEFEKSLLSDISEGWVIFASCKHSELSYAFEDNSMSVFTSYLIEGLKGNADDDNDSIISLENLNTYVTGMVSRWAIENGKIQTPNMNMQLVGTLNFSIIDPETSDTYSLKSDYSTTEKSAQSIILTSFYVSPSNREVYDNYGDILGFEDYTNDERKKMVIRNEEDFEGYVLAAILNYIKPRQVILNENDYVLPFGKLVNISESPYENEFKLIIVKDLFSQDITELFNSLDKQKKIKWNSIEYVFNGNFDFDIIHEITIDKGYLILDFQMKDDRSSIKIKIAQEHEDDGIILNSKWDISFENEKQTATMKITQGNFLEKEFFQTIPLTELIEIFSKSLRDN